MSQGFVCSKLKYCHLPGRFRAPAKTRPSLEVEVMSVVGAQFEVEDEDVPSDRGHISEQLTKDTNSDQNSQNSDGDGDQHDIGHGPSSGFAHRLYDSHAANT